MTGDRIYIQGPSTGVVEITISEIRVDLKEVSRASKSEMCSVPVDTLIRRGDKVYKIIPNAF
jgi:U32 family peptidase